MKRLWLILLLGMALAVPIELSESVEAHSIPDGVFVSRIITYSNTLNLPVVPGEKLVTLEEGQFPRAIRAIDSDGGVVETSVNGNSITLLILDVVEPGESFSLKLDYVVDRDSRCSDCALADATGLITGDGGNWLILSLVMLLGFGILTYFKQKKFK